MRKTQIYLPDEQWRELSTRSRKLALPVTELVRRAVAQVYPVRRRSNFERALDSVTGMWADRHDIESTDEYIRSLRKSNRLERIAA